MKPSKSCNGVTDLVPGLPWVYRGGADEGPLGLDFDRAPVSGEARWATGYGRFLITGRPDLGKRIDHGSNAH